MVNLGSNKRRFERLNFRSPIRYQVRGKPEFSSTLCDNISLGGISFISEEFIPRETPVMLEIKVLSRVLRPVAKVAWSNSLPHCDRKKLGLEFLEFNWTEKAYLSDYISMQTTSI